MLALILVLLGWTPPQATLVTVLFVLSIFYGRFVTREFGPSAGILILGGFVLVCGIGVRRTSAHWLPAALVVALVAGTMMEPVSNLARSVASHGESSAAVPRPVDVQMSSTPDVWVVVFDGYPGIDGMQLDMGDEYATQLQARLADGGLSTGASAWSSFWITDYSVPSILTMNYPVQTIVESPATRASMYEVVSGENALVSLFNANDYQTVMVESGWSGSSCGSSFDSCVPSPWYDEAMYLLLSRSIVADQVLRERGYPFTSGAQASMEWMLQNAEALSFDGHPTFVFAHVMAPHPPFSLDASCDTRFTEARSGVTFDWQGVPAGERDGYLREQMECLNRFMLNLRDEAGDQTILVLTADHGTDRRGQVVIPPDDWDDTAIVERMSAFLAVSGPACPVGNPVILPNLMRRVLSCHVVGGFPDLAPRMFVGENHELDVERMVRLMSSES